MYHVIKGYRRFKGAACAIAAFLVFGLLVGCDRSDVTRVQAENMKIDSLEQIIPLTDTLVRPILYSNVNGLDRIPLSRAKKTFIAAMLPAVLISKHAIEMEQLRLRELAEQEWTAADSMFVAALRVRYNAKTLDELKRKIGTLPNSIVLAQAAVESSWGRSRFFIEGRNVFGVWSTDSIHPRMAATNRRKNKTIYVRSYDDISMSVSDYFNVLSRARSYRALRKARLETDDPFLLLAYLKSYSERKSAYTRLLRKIIDQNNLTQFDRYRIHPDFLIED